MKLSEFILLNEEEKKRAVIHLGVLIAKRNTLNCLVFLFQLGSYYVESYCNLKDKSVTEFRAFTNLKPLNLYLETIAIDDIFH